MTASKVNPNMFHGEERDGGYLCKNDKPTSASSPQWKGKVYLMGVGWYWLSAWEQDARNGLILKLRAQEMTDEHARKYCAPKPDQREKRPPRQPGPTHGNGAEPRDSDIPF